VTAFPYAISLIILLLGIIIVIWIMKTMRRVRTIARKEAADQLKKVIDRKKSPAT